MKGSRAIVKDRIEAILADITTLAVDAIVNAANNSLLGGGGVDGAIHRAAGSELLEECRKLNGCQTGQAKMTKGFNLPSKFVIHTVGPIWSGGGRNEDNLLTECYLKSLNLAIQNNIRTIAFPSISTGAYRFPLERAVRIAVKEVFSFLSGNQEIDKVIFVCFDGKTLEKYKEIITESQRGVN